MHLTSLTIFDFGHVRGNFAQVYLGKCIQYGHLCFTITDFKSTGIN